MMASSPEAEEDVAQDMDDTAKLLVGLLLDIKAEPAGSFHWDHGR